MLTCSKHADLVDKANLVGDYPEQLLEFKSEHEERVRMLTEVSGQSTTQVIVVQIPIDGFSVPLGKEVFEAIFRNTHSRRIQPGLTLTRRAGLTHPKDSPTWRKR